MKYKAIISLLIINLFSASFVRAENIAFGTLIDDQGSLFSSFGDQHLLGETRGANFGGNDVLWYGVNMSSSSGANGIYWNGIPSIGNFYEYSLIYSGSPGTAEVANNMTNTGYYGWSFNISISAVAGKTYLIDLLFANQFSGSTLSGNYYPYRTMDISVGGLLYADDLTLNGTESTDRRPLVYRFEFTPSSNSIEVAFSNGDYVTGFPTDRMPMVNAMTVTQVPEPSALLLFAVGLSSLGMIRRHRS